ncbi:MAG: hypothetical protein Q9226_003637 [Calogaya cf. arnoldii]
MDIFYRFSKRSCDKEMDLLSDSITATSSRGRQQSLPRPIDTSRGLTGLSGGLAENKPANSVEVGDLGFELQQKKKELSRLESDHDQLIQIHQATTKENQELKASITQLQDDLDTTRQHNSSMKHELQACKDDLFKMQPKREVPDSHVAKAYEELHVHISSWLEGEISHFETNYRKRHEGPMPNLFDHSNVPELKQILLEFPISGGEYFIRCIIQIMLHRMVFADDILLLGLDAQEKDLLQLIERSMGRANPPQGMSLIALTFHYLLCLEPEAVQSWRSDTLTALARTKHLQQNRLKLCQQLVHTLYDGMASYFPVIKETKESLQGFRDKVIGPAVKLANTIQTSATRYKFSPQIGEISPFSAHHLTHDQLSTATVIDVDSGKTLKADSPIQQDERGELGKHIMLLAPALYRHNPGQARILLVKEIVLVKLRKPLGRRRAATSNQPLQDRSSLI